MGDDRLRKMVAAAALPLLLLLVETSWARMDFAISAVAVSQPGLSMPTSIAYHPWGLWVVSDTGNDRVVLFNRDLSMNRTVEGTFRRPRGLAVDDAGRIWVVDGGNDRVVVLDPFLSLVASVGSSGDGIGQFRSPWGIAIDSMGRVAVADSLNRRVQVMDGTLQILGVIGSWGTRPGEFDGPLDVAFDSLDRLFVVDTYLEAEGFVRRVQVFNPDLTFNATIWDIESRLRFTRPVGIGIGGDDVVAVADFLANRIYLFDREGQHMGGFSVVPNQPDVFRPYDVAFACVADGYSYLGLIEKEPGRIRVVRFSVSEMQAAALLCLTLPVAVRRWLPCGHLGSKQQPSGWSQTRSRSPESL